MATKTTASRTYEYVVRNKSGKVVKGRIEATNQAAVANRLKTCLLYTSDAADE